MVSYYKKKIFILRIHFQYDRPRPPWGAEMSSCFHFCILESEKVKTPRLKCRSNEWRSLSLHRGLLVKSIWGWFLSAGSGSVSSVALVTDHTNNIMAVETVALWIYWSLACRGWGIVWPDCHSVQREHSIISRVILTDHMKVYAPPPEMCPCILFPGHNAD